jgi:hypothetical protein
MGGSQPHFAAGYLRLQAASGVLAGTIENG